MEDKLDILVNNAGMAFHSKFEQTVDGHELIWQTNHLGIFYIFNFLYDYKYSIKV